MGQLPANGTATSPTSRGWPPSSARPTSPESRKPARPTAKSSARPIPRIPIWSSGLSRPRPSSKSDPRFQQRSSSIATSEQAPLVVGGLGADFSAEEHESRRLQLRTRRRLPTVRASAATTKFTSSPSANTFPSRTCSSLPTSSPAASRSSRAATSARSFASTGHRYGVFICYEAVFADEVRQFSQLGAEVLVNISDDGWYGDTSAPWQHLNMARMSAIENRRWILRDTNNGVTAVIDPYGRVRQSIPAPPGRCAARRNMASATTSPSTPRTATSSRGCAYCFRLPFSSGR